MPRRGVEGYSILPRSTHKRVRGRVSTCRPKNHCGRETICQGPDGDSLAFSGRNQITRFRSYQME
ncbi:hypothetical protein M413DRAFT_445474 [Hebeloma cylindrosporum]|uniref:Uncharacterized protein n=1 Tax=Hebeloma cylindrosporum TaxID=76867 RepID=A0A0C3CCY2_HEBCY|nr:hypothetical protein M413DRAFT_445474 [Hebeloma cylindrosporum h7]